jgi:monofunctional biosynthetic peptidoglycan transglycosylase
MTEAATSHRLLARAGKWLAIAAVAFVGASVLLVVPLRWIDPPTSAFMVRHWIHARLQDRAPPVLFHDWADWSEITADIPLAVIAAEDQRFPAHRGFDLVEMRNAWARYQAGGRLRGASTLSQQTAKNLFLWPGRDWLRKGLEAWLTLLIELSWPKQRILEVYLNIAQFGPDTYGVGAASWRFFDRPPIALGRGQAALLAAVLPNPDDYSVASPSSRVRRRAAWIERQMRQLGGSAYLRAL